VTALRRARLLSALPHSCENSDAELLERFIRMRDEASFAALVNRHGSLVLGVCRRVLRDSHAAEDAFQAVFLVLARKAESIRKGEALGGWLYEVAYRVALRARTRTVRHREHERRAAAMTTVDTPDDSSANRELQAVLDEELLRLPEKHRTVLVLRYLQGKTAEQTAREVGCPLGSVSWRLARARELLRERLAQRGIVLPAAGLAVFLGAAVSPALAAVTARAGSLFASSPAAAAGLASAEAFTLAQGALRAMLSCNLRLALLFCLTLGLLAVGGPARTGEQAPLPAPLPVAAPGGEAPAKADGTSVKESPAASLPEGAVTRLGSPGLRHPNVFFTAFLPGGKEVLTACLDGKVRRWDLATARVVGIFDSHDGLQGAGRADPGPGFIPRDLFRIAVSPDGKTAATHTWTRTIQLWDVKTGRPGIVIDGQANHLAFSPDGKTLLAAGYGNVLRLWDVTTGKELHEKLRITEKGCSINWAAFSPDGKTVFTFGAHTDAGTIAPHVILWDVATGKEVRRMKLDREISLWQAALAPDGKSFAWCSGEDVYIWDITRNRLLRKFGPAGREREHSTVLFSPDGKTLGVRGHQTLSLWDVATGKQLAWFPKRHLIEGQVAHRSAMHGTVSNLAFSPDGKKFLTTTDDTTLRIWDMASGKESPPLPGHRDAVFAAAGRGKAITTLGNDGSAWIWDPATGKALRRLDLPGSAAALAVSASGEYVASLGREETFRVLKVVTGKERGAIHAEGTGPFSSVRLSPDGGLLAAQSLNGARTVWDTATGKKVGRPVEAATDLVFRGRALPERWVFGTNPPLAFSPDGRMLASLDNEVAMKADQFGNEAPYAFQKIRLADATTGRVLRSFGKRVREDTAMTFTPDGRCLATRDREGILLWEIASGNPRLHIKGLSLHIRGLPSGIPTVAFSPDSRVLATAAWKTVHLLDADTGKLLAKLDGHDGAVASLTFTSDGKRLISGSADTTAFVWNVAPLVGKSATPASELTAKELDAAWIALQSADAEKAFAAILTLAASPEKTLEMLRTRLQPVQLDARKIDQLIVDLGSARFRTRKVAIEELELLAEAVEPALNRALAGKPSLEVRKRIEALLHRLFSGMSPEALRATRAVEVLERIGSSKARKLLQSLAGGFPDATLTRESRRAFERQ
jgi:RNA polymerase sigma factor (sigma-70 family)